MATLTARGARVLAKVELTEETPESELTISRTTRRVYRSDGVILECSVVQWRNPAAWEDRSHNYGWKVRGRAKAGVTAEEWARAYEGKGWKRTG